LNDPDLAEEIDQRSKRFVKENFSTEKVVDQLERLYEGIIDD